MDKETKLKTAEGFWYARNPCHDFDQEGNDRFYRTAYMCMEDFAKQQAIGFAEFILTSHYQPFGSAWTNDMLKTITTEELYSLYKEQIK